MMEIVDNFESCALVGWMAFRFSFISPKIAAAIVDVAQNPNAKCKNA